MNVRRIIAIALTIALLPAAALAGRGFAGGGGFSRGGGGAPRGGFDFHNDAPKPGQTQTHSSTGPAGTNRNTSVTNTGNGYDRSTTASNGSYNRTSGGSTNSNGNVSHYSNTNTAYGSQHSSTSGNTNSGNYNHSGSGSNVYGGSYSNSGSGNAYNRTYSGSGTATNAYGQTYRTGTYVNNGYVYHGAVVTNPVYHGYPVYGWNGGVAWYPAPYYYGGGFWGAFAIGAATSAIVYGSIVAANSQTYTSYQVEPSSPGSKLLASYNLTQVPCVNNGLVVIYGPNNSVICAKPNNLVAAGNYSVDSSTLTIVSEKPAT